ncbi:hypothetical protein G7Z17_g9788 [Cylindrodendrum hubeiense]|uniref:Zn(2)-C6 fungal-type domain-containing protein n=1 Tax=Cylindrodendrum hubeiense TaxID=595255 RepID=A0A9P5H4B8_9HYPO|nr:hypothetical protein G7Z17_g9788 [Cylindrodendrum hubeiense]
MSHCSQFASLDDFKSYVDALSEATGFDENKMRACRSEICDAVAVGYVVDLALGIILSLAVIFLKPDRKRNDRVHEAYEICTAGLSAFFDSAAYFAFALQLATIAVLVRKDYGISTLDMGALETEIAQAVAVVSLLPLLYPVALLEGGRGGEARHNARLLLLSVTVALSFYPFMSRCFHAFGESPIGDGKYDDVSTDDWQHVETMCFPGGLGGLTEFMESTTYKALNGLELAINLIIYLFTFWLMASLPGSHYPPGEKPGMQKSLARRERVNDWFGQRRFIAALPLFTIIGLAVPLLWVIFRMRILQKDLAESLGEKTRHLKCDERKPTCYRCEKDRVGCDGYKVAPPRRAKKEPVKLPMPGKALVTQSVLSPGLILNPGLGADVSALPAQVDLFHHFRTSTIHDLTMGFASTDFWHVHVLPLGHAVEPVKYALCALGGVHRHFKTQHQGVGTSAFDPKLDKVVIQHYNQAIHHIKSFVATASESNIEVVLTCCVIFICIENLQGRYTEALCHLRAAPALIASLRQSSTTPTSDIVQYKETSSVPRFVDEISELLYHLGADMSFFLGSEIVPGITCQSLDTVAIQYPTAPFSSCAAAVKSLRAVEMIDNSVRYYFELNYPYPEADDDSHNNSPPESDSDGQSGHLFYIKGVEMTECYGRMPRKYWIVLKLFLGRAS